MDKTHSSKKRKLDALSGNENKSETKHKNKKRRNRQFEGNLQPNQTNEPTEEKPTKDNPKPDYKEVVQSTRVLGHSSQIEHWNIGSCPSMAFPVWARRQQFKRWQSFTNEMDLVCLKAKKMTAKELLLKLDYISIKTIQALLQSTSEAVKADKFILNHEKNSLHQFIEPGVLALPLGEELVTKVLQAKKEQLQYNSTLNVEDLVIIHFDDCQSWVSPQYKHKMDDEIIEYGIEARMYRLISFSECLPYTPSNFRFAFTGTHFEVDRLLRFDSKMKLVLANVNLTTVEDVKYLLNAKDTA